VQDWTPSRPWRVITGELANEHDQKRITQLSEELNRAPKEQWVGSSTETPVKPK
jgi:hypothetical protein